MDIPLQPILFAIPSLAQIFLLRRAGIAWRAAFARVGWLGSKPIYFAWALGIIVPLGGLAWLAQLFIPAELFQSEHVSLSAYTGMSPTLATLAFILLREAIYTALGEEVFFRGWLGGWLVRRFGFPVGNTIQAFAFLLPHLLLLTIGLDFWPILVPQFIAGWLFGWLRHRSGSILPGWFAHTLSNVLGAWGSL